MSYAAKRYGFIPRFIETSGEINEFMRVHAVNLAEKGLKQVDKKMFGAKVTIMGLAYKKNIDDARESPSIKIIEELVNRGAKVRVYDPYVKSIKTNAGEFYSEKSIEDGLVGAVCAVFVTDHDVFKKMKVERMNEIPVVVDCKNIFKNQKTDFEAYFGIGKIN